MEERGGRRKSKEGWRDEEEDEEGGGRGRGEARNFSLNENFNNRLMG